MNYCYPQQSYPQQIASIPQQEPAYSDSCSYGQQPLQQQPSGYDYNKQFSSQMTSNTPGQMPFPDYQQQLQQQQPPSQSLWISQIRRPPQEEFARMRYAFERADKNRSGFIEAGELSSMLYEMGEDWSPSTVDLMIKMFDHDNDYTVSFNEFQDLWAYLTEMKTAFRSYHQNNNISLYNAENALERTLYNTVNSYQPTRGLADLNSFNNIVANLFRMFDKQGTGQLSQNSFMKMSLVLGQILTSYQRRMSGYPSSSCGGYHGNYGMSCNSNVGTFMNLANMAMGMKRGTSDETNADVDSPNFLDRSVGTQGDISLDDFAQDWMKTHSVE